MQPVGAGLGGGERVDYLEAVVLWRCQSIFTSSPTILRMKRMRFLTLPGVEWPTVSATKTRRAPASTASVYSRRRSSGAARVGPR